MKYLKHLEHQRYMEIAWEEAKKAKCKKSHFGAVIVKGGKVISTEHNAPVDEKECSICLRLKHGLGSGKGSELCYSVHAEQRALLNALKNRKNIEGGVMYIGHLKNGEIKKFSGKPFCTICSKLIAASGLKGVMLYNGDNYVFLSSKEFHDESFKTVIEYYSKP